MYFQTRHYLYIDDIPARLCFLPGRVTSRSLKNINGIVYFNRPIIFIIEGLWFILKNKISERQMRSFIAMYVAVKTSWWCNFFVVLIRKSSITWNEGRRYRNQKSKKRKTIKSKYFLRITKYELKFELNTSSKLVPRWQIFTCSRHYLVKLHLYQNVTFTIKLKFCWKIVFIEEKSSYRKYLGPIRLSANTTGEKIYRRTRSYIYCRQLNFL